MTALNNMDPVETFASTLTYCTMCNGGLGLEYTTENPRVRQVQL